MTLIPLIHKDEYFLDKILPSLGNVNEKRFL